MKTKHYGEVLDKWLDQKYPEMQLVRAADKIAWRKQNGKQK